MWTALLVLLLAQSDLATEGLKALDAGQTAKAIELLSKAAAADPSDYSAHFNLGLAYSLAEKDADAIPEYKKVLELKPGLYEAELNLGLSLMNTGSPAAAAPYLKQAAEQKPNEFRPNYSYAEALLETKQWADAETAFRHALEINAGSVSAELGLGQAIAHQGRRIEAEPHYRKAAQLDPAERNFLLELASLREENHETQQALDLYREFPDNPAAQERVGVLSLQLGQIEAAIAALEPVVAKSPTPANQLALAQAYVKNKQTEKAEPLVAKALASAPNDFEVRLFYGRILRDQHSYPAAAQQFSAAVGIKPDSVEAWSELAAALNSAEQPEGTLKALDRIRALNGETAGHLYLRAITLDKLGQKKEALESYTKFLEASQNKNPDQEFLARQRVRIIEKDLGKR